MNMLNWNWELIGIIVGIVVSILGGVWFIVNKAAGFGQFSHRVDVMDKRTCHAACESHGSDIDALKENLDIVKSDVIAIKSLLLMKHKDASSV